MGIAGRRVTWVALCHGDCWCACRMCGAMGIATGRVVALCHGDCCCACRVGGAVPWGLLLGVSRGLGARQLVEAPNKHQRWQLGSSLPLLHDPLEDLLAQLPDLLDDHQVLGQHDLQRLLRRLVHQEGPVHGVHLHGRRQPAGRRRRFAACTAVVLPLPAGPSTAMAGRRSAAAGKGASSSRSFGASPFQASSCCSRSQEPCRTLSTISSQRRCCSSASGGSPPSSAEPAQPRAPPGSCRGSRRGAAGWPPPSPRCFSRGIHGRPLAPPRRGSSRGASSGPAAAAAPSSGSRGGQE